MLQIAKFEWAENIRFFATISVIIIHVASSGMYLQNSIGIADWWMVNLIESVTRVCVPLFFMLSGALILSKTYDTKTFIYKRINRTFFPFLLWSLVFSTGFYVYYFIGGRPQPFLELITNLVFYKGIFQTQEYHLWFVYVLLGIYIISKPMQNFITTIKRKHIPYFVFIGLIVVVINMLPFSFEETIQSRIIRFSGYICFYIFGYFIVKFDMFTNNKKVLLIGIIFLVLITSWLTYYFSFLQDSYYGNYFHFLSVNIVIYSCLLFSLLKTIKINNETLLKIRTMINKKSYGIYLIHVPVLFALEKIGIEWNLFHPIVGVFITVILCLVISLFVLKITEKIPFVGKFTF